MLWKLLRGVIATLVASAPARAVTLEEASKSEFFTFFHLERSCDPEPAGRDRIWHCFRPSGDKFRRVVELAVLVDGVGQIRTSRLALDRGFVDDRTDGVFARDVVKSFLTWAVPGPVPEEARGLIDNIADFSSSGAPMMLRGAQTARPRPDTTGGYGVFLGRSARADVDTSQTRIVLTNVEGSLPANRVFAVDVRAAVVDALRMRQGMTPAWLAVDVTPGTGAGTRTLPRDGAPSVREERVPPRFELTPAIIREVQTRLYDLNYNPGPINGRIGPATIAAVKQVQQRAGLPVTGEIDAALLATLRDARPAQHWGAVAFHADGGHVPVWLRGSRRDAEEEAMRDCTRRFGRGCKAVTISGSRCIALALASGRTGRRRSSSGSYGSPGATVSEAGVAAIDNCRRNSPVPDACQVRTVICADGSHGR